MGYQRFRLQVCPATLATSATLQGETAQTVATVARTAAQNREPPPQTVADVATVARGSTENTTSNPNASSLDIAIALERAASRLRSQGYPRHELSARARVLVSADLRNSMALFVRQSNLNRCHVCGGRESPDFAFIAVLSAKPDHPHWIHAACHAEHVQRVDARVEAALGSVSQSASTAAPVRMSGFE